MGNFNKEQAMIVEGEMFEASNFMKRKTLALAISRPTGKGNRITFPKQSAAACASTSL
jgi:hypothetical protein